jgi:hypothetical protein
MQIIAFIVQIVVLWASTALVVGIDRARRVKDGTYGGMFEPETGALILLGILCNVACLPYYFQKTRNSAGGLFIGFGLFLACSALMFVFGVATSLVLTLAGVR